MGNWVRNNRSEIQFVIWMVVGIFLIIRGAGVGGGAEPGLIALGAGAIGLPGYTAASDSRKKEREDDDKSHES